MKAWRWIHTWRWPLALLLALGVWLCVQPVTARAACGDGGTICVDADAPPDGNGQTWATAYNSLQDALGVAVSGNQIWVAEGVYYPGSTRDSTFTLRDGVALYGGFAATETELTQRDWTAHVTVLSGDIDENDVNDDDNSIAETWNDLQGSNAYHVVTGGGVTETAQLDGFTVTAGYANGAGNNSHGGGMRNDASSPTLTHVTFSGNRAGEGGGGMYNLNNSNPTLMHVTFSGNRANSGGGMRNRYSSPTLTHVTFSGNQADDFGGGGMDNNNSNPTLTHVTFSGNQAGYMGGGMYNISSTPTLTNVTLSGNWAYSYGGGMYNRVSSPALTNVTFGGNRAGESGGGMYNEASTPTLVNCILWGDSAPSGPEIYNDNNSSTTITYSDIQGWSGGGTGNLARDPQFIAPIDASSAPTTTGNYRLREDSPAIDAGDPVTCPADDLDDQPRADLRCDMGAYERQYRDGDTVIKSDFTGGTPYSFGPTWVSMTLSAENTGSVTVTKHLTPPGGVWDTGEISVTWWISSSLSAGFSAMLSLCYTDDEVAGLNESRLAMFRWNGSAWVDQNATPDPDNNCVTLSGVTGFSAWTLKDTSVGATTPTAARVAAVAARGFAPVAALPLVGLLVLGGAAVLRRRRR